MDRKTLEGRGSDVLTHFAQRNPPTFEAREVADFLQVDSAVAARILSVLATRGWLTRHRKGVYEVAPLWASSENPFDPDRFSAIGRWMREPYYVGFRSALEIRDWLDYPVRGRLWIAVPASRHAPKTLRDRVTWVVLRTSLFSWGRERHWVGSETIWVSDPERTILDGLHLPRHVGGVIEIAAVLVRVWSSIDRGRLVSHSEKYGIEAVRRRLGFLLETLKLPGHLEVSRALHRSLSQRRRSPTVLDPTQPSGGPTDRRWGVQVNLDPQELEMAGRT